MATSKRRSATVAAAPRTRAGVAPRRTQTAQTRHANDPRLVLALVAGTIVLLAVILVVTLSHSTSSATPTSLPSAAAPTAAARAGGPATGNGPVAGIGVLDANAGLAQKSSVPKEGSPAPNFGWRTTAGHQTLRGLRGHAVLLEFFAPWCPQCQSEVPMVNTIMQQGAAKGLRVLAISSSPYGKDYETGGNESPISMADLIWYRQQFGVQYPLIFDSGSRVFNLYGYGQSYPTYVVIDARGVVRFRTDLAISATDLAKQVNAALG